MNCENYNEIWEILKELLDEIDVLFDSFDDVNDCIKIMRMRERIFAFDHEVQSFFIMEDLIEKMESEKDRFEVQKAIQKAKNALLESINSNIRIGRTWKYKDYRGIDWEKRYVEIFMECKTYFTNYTY